MTIAFPAQAAVALRQFYPETPGLIAHDLIDHPLLKLEMLAALAGRLRPVDVEYNRADLPIGVDPAETPSNGLSVAETIHSIEQCGSWMVLKFIEQDPVYRDFLAEVLSGLEEAVRPATGDMLKPQGFLFVSSPDAVTPFHFDPEHNVLLQIRGSKTMTVFPADDERIVDGVEHERFHAGGHRNLPWRDSIAAHGTPFELVPGSAIYVPVKAPHWVRNGPEVSISLSVTWRSEWSFREEYARKMNAIIREVGLRPRSPRRFPHQNRAKSLGFRVVDKVRRLAGRPSS